MRTDQRRPLGWLASSMYSGDLPPGQAVSEQLDRLGFAPDDLAVVVLLHLHSDHVSGVELVDSAKRILVSTPEWDARTDFGYIPSMWNGISIEPVELTAIPYGPFGSGLDLFGDDSV